MNTAKADKQTGEGNALRKYAVFAISKRRNGCFLKLWNQKQGCFNWVSKHVKGPFLQKII